MEIAARLATRSEDAVEARAFRLGLTTYGRRWTPPEDDGLRALAARGTPPPDIARALLCTTAAVRRRAERLGLDLPKVARRDRTAWTEREDELLREWRALEAGRLAQLLGRTDRSVHARLRTLGLVPNGRRTTGRRRRAR